MGNHELNGTSLCFDYIYLFSALRQPHQKEDDRKFKVEKLENQLKPKIFETESRFKRGVLLPKVLSLTLQAPQPRATPWIQLWFLMGKYTLYKFSNGSEANRTMPPPHP